MDTTIEDIFTAVENEAAPVYERMAAGELPKGTDREAFAQFLGIMYTRTPEARALGASAAKFTFETQIAATAAHDGAFRTFLKRMEADGKDVSDPERIRRKLLDMSHSDLILPKGYVLSLIGSSPEFANLFLNMNWSLFRAESHFFVTCDNPMFHSVDPKTVHPLRGRGGLANKTSQVTFPLSPRRLLLLTWQEGIPFEVPMERKWAMAENVKRVAAADRQIYSHFKYRKLGRMAVQFDKPEKPAPHRQGFAGSTGFNSVIVPRKRSGSLKKK